MALAEICFRRVAALVEAGEPALWKTVTISRVLCYSRISIYYLLARNFKLTKRNIVTTASCGLLVNQLIDVRLKKRKSCLKPVM